VRDRIASSVRFQTSSCLKPRMAQPERASAKLHQCVIAEPWNPSQGDTSQECEVPVDLSLPPPPLS
jgi:hypothetical protein